MLIHTVFLFFVRYSYDERGSTTNKIVTVIGVHSTMHLVHPNHCQITMYMVYNLVHTRLYMYACTHVHKHIKHSTLRTPVLSHTHMYVYFSFLVNFTT